MSKKKWTMPELTVIVRAKPEETVLTTCKTGPAGQSSPSAPGLGCRVTAPGPCAFCLQLAPS
jgi:hypothetical protein